MGLLKFEEVSLNNRLSGIAAFLSFSLLIASQAQSQIIAPSAEEVLFSYSATVEAPLNSNTSPIELARHQATHLFGIFSSPNVIRSYRLNPEAVGGIGAPNADMNIRILATRRTATTVQIDYTNQGKLILHKTVANALLRTGEVSVPLPRNPFAIYLKKCTDPHYQGFEDFWYFYDPYRLGCESLSRAPLAPAVKIKISALNRKKKDLTARLDLLRGANRNGNLFSIYVMHGFSESYGPQDDGRISFEELNNYLRQKGFQERSLRVGTTRPLHIFTKSIRLTSGQLINVEVKHLLVESEADSRTVTFAKFFKEAVENADVIAYAGHSGLGANLDLPTLQAKAGRFIFPSGKRQIYFFDSCSSYSYYLSTFSAEKTRATIDVITNGLSSYFETGNAVMSAFMEVLLSPQLNDIGWNQFLKRMESPLEGATYLLNVGGI